LKDEVFRRDLWIIGQLTTVVAAGIAGRIGSCSAAWWQLIIVRMILNGYSLGATIAQLSGVFSLLPFQNPWRLVN
jgi:hypothetical protein